MGKKKFQPFHAVIIRGEPHELEAIAEMVRTYRENGAAPNLNVMVEPFVIDCASQENIITIATEITRASQIRKANEWAACKAVGDRIRWQDDATRELRTGRIERVGRMLDGEVAFYVDGEPEPVAASDAKMWESGVAHIQFETAAP